MQNIKTRAGQNDDFRVTATERSDFVSGMPAVFELSVRTMHTEKNSIPTSNVQKIIRQVL